MLTTVARGAAVRRTGLLSGPGGRRELWTGSPKSGHHLGCCDETEAYNLVQNHKSSAKTQSLTIIISTPHQMDAALSP
ncbi:succinyl-CoA:glutarate CoA-transferase isoform X2 [Pteropus medius]|uniref:succinate--hydroxymethylglutarate CoA-transferase isoform X2 n=1 Tax=Pteropus vampyrus TaxID=132908 RepID=UPI00196A62CB|nr:succinate--hydroxymethylglutarate CoA-transferase isoform X2 [Pteropus giganteus]